jgi:hypothetical protein
VRDESLAALVHHGVRCLDDLECTARSRLEINDRAKPVGDVERRRRRAKVGDIGTRFCRRGRFPQIDAPANRAIPRGVNHANRDWIASEKRRARERQQRE